MPKREPQEFDGWDRLHKSIERDRLRLEDFRELQLEFVRKYAGKYYSQSTDIAEQPVNLIAQYNDIVVRHLVASNPRVMLGISELQHKPTVAAMEKHTNKRLAKMHVDEILRDWSQAAIFGIGILKCALADPGEVADDYRKTAGEAFLSAIDFDDWVHDTGTKKIHKSAYMGHRICLPLAMLTDSDLYDQEVVKSLAPIVHPRQNESGDDRISTLSYEDDGWDGDYEDYVEIWEIWLRRQGLIVTLSLDHEQPLRVQPWIGPGCGPFHFLSYCDVPGNAMPLPPIAQLVDLHDLTNELYRKLGAQASRQKSITLVQKTMAKDGARVIEANDGDVIPVDDPQSCQEFRFGGPDQVNLAFTIRAMDDFSRQAGNLDVLGGLGPQADTATQEKMLQSNSSAKMRAMQQRTINATRDVLTALEWFYWHDPYQTYKVRREIPGVDGAEITAFITPRDRLVPFEELDIDIDPYSMSDDSPQTRLAALNQVMTQVLIPMSQILMQQGIQIDIEAWLKLIARYQNMPDLFEIVKVAQSQFDSLGPSMGESPTKPGQTTRTYERVNRPGGTRFGRDNALMQSLLGKGVQESEATAALQPAG